MILRKGQQSPDVLNLERALQGLGYSGFEADGFFDEKTENVIKNIQKTNGLSVDGIVGEQTLAVIDRIFEPNKPNFSSSNFIEKPAAVISNEFLPSILRNVHPKLAEKATQIVSLAQAENYQLRITQGLRTFAEQDKLFAKRPKVTNARGGFSFHNYGIAVDFAFVVNGNLSWDEKLYKNIGRWASRVGLEWGGNWHFVDLPHCQLPNMTSIRALLNCYNANGGGEKGIQSVWKIFVK
mgnify:CR=1 FL=1